MRLLLIGCTGFIGRELIPQLIKAGHQLTIVSRKSPNKKQLKENVHKISYIKEDPSKEKFLLNKELKKALINCEGVINLAGEPIAEKRWTPDHCKILFNSRVNTTKILINAISSMKKPPKILINASAIGFYGTSQNATFHEESNHGNDFLAGLCKEWETIARKKPVGTRLLILRIGLVLGADGGALRKMLPIFKAGFGGPIGNGKQWISWIHRCDLCQIIVESLHNQSWEGVVNGVSPHPVSMNEFSETLGRTLGRPSLLPVPGTILKLLLGDGAKVVLEGQYVQSNRINQLGYKFQYPQLNSALSEITR